MRDLPVIVQTVLNEYIALLNERLPNTLEGLYIQGSIALNAYVEDSSDVDFITVINRRLSVEEVDMISEIHSILAEKYPKPEMDGIYILWEDIGKLEADGNIYPFYNEGKMSYGIHFNSITWWILKTDGISIIGPEPTALGIEIHSQHLVSYVLENMNTYWAVRIQRTEYAMEGLLQLPTEVIDAEIEWSILGLLRQYYTLKEQGIISKLSAAEYAMQNVPVEWHPIIKEAINIHNGVRMKIFTSELERVDTTLRFLKYIIRYCNRTFIQKTFN